MIIGGTTDGTSLAPNALALAELRSLELLTADEKLVRRAGSAGLSTSFESWANSVDLQRRECAAGLPYSSSPSARASSGSMIGTPSRIG